MFPDFLVIGGQRCGTGWLETFMRRHPRIWLSPRKEVHYFDRDDKRMTPWPQILNVSDRNQRRNIAKMLSVIKKIATTRGDYHPGWFFRYYFFRRNDDWYGRLFPKINGRLTGDMTPAYSVLSQEKVAHIASIMPDVKILFTLRNPIDRSWSHAKKDFVYGKAVKSLDTIPKTAFMQHFISDLNYLRSNYVRTLRNWESCFPSRQIHLNFFDDLYKDPANHLKKIFAFLEIDENPELPEEMLKTVVNSYSNRRIPDDLKYFLARLHLDQMKKLSDRFGGYPRQWYEEAQAIIDTTNQNIS
ncbi:MAG: sulfotransferase domain-containing protein [Thermodesulfobacteriota bacterium]|nr:sulfotransferase domain-containing protein [Thermodesulfobacteriota bacterium]